MEKRSDSDVLLKVLRLHFGDKEYEVPVLRMKAAARWRQEYFDRTKEISASMIVDSIGDNGELSTQVGNALTAAMLKFPDKIPELVFSYAPDLPKDEIMDVAYDDDFSHAFSMIYRVAFQPFLASLGTVLEMQRAQQQSRSDSSANSN